MPDNSLSVAGRRVEPSAHGAASDPQFEQRLTRSFDEFPATAKRPGIGHEFPAQTDRRGVLEVGPPRFHDMIEVSGFAPATCFETSQPRLQMVPQQKSGRQANGGRSGV